MAENAGRTRITESTKQYEVVAGADHITILSEPRFSSNTVAAIHGIVEGCVVPPDQTVIQAKTLLG
jgi:hypothetical protein